MGNTLETEKIDSSVKKEFQLDKKLFDEIHGKSKLLYDRYKTEFLSKSFCQQVSITYSKMLYKLPMKSLRKIHDKLYDESKDQNIADLDLVVTYNPMNEEKFLVDYLRGKIIENFKNKKIDKNVTKNGIKLTMPDIYYIQNRALQVLDQAYKREYGKKQRGGNYELFLGGSTNEDEINNNDNNNKINFGNLNNEREKNNNNEGNNNNNEGNNEENNEENNSNKEENNTTENRSINELEKRLQKLIPQNAQPANNGKNKQKSNNGKSTPSNNGRNEKNEPANKVKNISANNGKNTPTNNTNKKNEPANNGKNTPTNNANKRNLANNGKNTQPVNATNGKNEPTNNGKNKKNQKGNVTELPVNNTKQQQRRLKNIEASGDRYCLDENEECKLTKKEICEKIAYHFIVRNNIIAAIMSTIPFPNKDGEYYGSMTYKRLLSLTKGSFCMPTPTFWKNFKDDDTDERLEKIQKYLNFTDPNECKRNNGTILQLSKENLQDLLKGGPLGRKYWEYVEKINLLYHECLMKFSEVLEILQLNDNLTTNNLNEISKRVKYIIDELYTNTQLNYILAVMVLLDYDFEKKRLVKEKKYNKKQERLAIIEQGGKTV